MDTGFAQGLEKATGTVAATGMELMRLKIAQDENQRRETAFQYEVKAKQEQEAQDNQWLPASAVSKNIAQFPTIRQSALDFFQKNGYEYKEMGGELYFQQKAAKAFLKGIATSDEMRNSFTQSAITDLDAQTANLIQQRQELAASGKTDEKSQKTLQQLDEQLLQNKTSIAQLIGASSDMQKKLMLERAKHDPGNTQNEANWIAIINNPNTTPEQKAIAQKNISLLQKGKVTTAVNIDTGKQKQWDDKAAKIGDAIISGVQPPEVGGFGLAKVAPQVRAYLADKGFDLTAATSDWLAVKKYVSSMNSTQQVRLKQATKFSYDSLDIIQNLATQWDAGNFPLLNSANLVLASQGAYGKDAAKIATKLQAQIADLTSELGTVYKGGNSSTDESLKLAAQNLKANWNKDVLIANIDQVRQNLGIRLNSLKHTSIGALSTGSKYGRLSPEETVTPGQKPTATNAPPANLLKEGIQTTFKNGQVWMLQNGQPVQVK